MATGSLARFGRGAVAPLRGLGFLVRNARALLPWAVAPALLNVALVGLAALLAVKGSGWVVDAWLWPEPVRAGPKLIWDALTWALALWLFVIAALALYLASGVLASPFYDRLSQAVEDVVSGARPPQSWSEWGVETARSVLHSLLGLTLWLVCLLALSLLNLLPVVGSVLEVVLSLIVTGFLVAREMLDGALTRRGMSFLDKLRFLGRHLAFAEGFGLATATLLWVPLLNFAVMPLAVIGGTLLLLELEQREGPVS